MLSVGNAFANVKGILSYKPGALPTDLPTPYSPEVNPKNVYTSLTGLFQSGTPTPADYKAMQGKSILDLCKADIDALAAKNMSMKDKQRLTDWKALMRSVETTVVHHEGVQRDQRDQPGHQRRGPDGGGQARHEDGVHAGHRHDDQPHRADHDVRRATG